MRGNLFKQLYGNVIVTLNSFTKPGHVTLPVASNCSGAKTVKSWPLTRSGADCQWSPT